MLLGIWRMRTNEHLEKQKSPKETSVAFHHAIKCVCVCVLRKPLLGGFKGKPRGILQFSGAPLFKVTHIRASKASS